MLWIYIFHILNMLYCQNTPNGALGSVPKPVWFPDGVEHTARMTPLGSSHLCPPGMTVGRETYGAADRGGAPVKVEERAACDCGFVGGHTSCWLAPAGWRCGRCWWELHLVFSRSGVCVCFGGVRCQSDLHTSAPHTNNVNKNGFHKERSKTQWIWALLFLLIFYQHVKYLLAIAGFYIVQSWHHCVLNCLLWFTHLSPKKKNLDSDHHSQTLWQKYYH